MLFFETSAKNNTNVELAFQALILRVIKRQEEMGKILGNDAGKGPSIKPGQNIGNNNMNRRANRSTKTKVVLGKMDADKESTKKNSNCAKCN